MDQRRELQQNNMISNLPLLFANGYPTSLDKITESQLENFIPFMVQCSLGHINVQGKPSNSEPEWWPEDIPFSIPFYKPKKFNGNWMEKMKEVVVICYQFHKSVFLLRFCNDLSSYEHASLRFINNYNSTTSLFDRRSNKLLVTFRNENMSYDQPQRSRKCLLQQKQRNGRENPHEMQEIMVEPAPFDIYLCDNCDAELYSREAILEHEKTCNHDDDVILCPTPEPIDETQQHACQQNENNEQRIGFLLNFNLQCRNVEKKQMESSVAPSASVQVSAQEEQCSKKKRMTRRNRTIHSVARCPTIPLSSPAGQLLLRITKATISSDYLSERLDRIERFCYTPLLSSVTSRPKYFEKKYSTLHPHCSFKKPLEYSSHLYVFPRRQFSQKRRTKNFLLLNSTLIRRCRPISVKLKKMSYNDIKSRHVTSTSKFNIKLRRDNSSSSNWKISSSPSSEIIVDTIDLCTSDEEDNNNVTTFTKFVKSNAKDSSSTDATTGRTCLKKLNFKLNSPEVSLIPIKKTAESSSERYDSIASTFLQIIPPVDPIVVNESPEVVRRSRCDNDGPLLPINVATTDSDNNATKPLRSSVLIFSNFCTNRLTNIMTPSSNLVSSNHFQESIINNQENLKQASSRKSTTTTNTWFTSGDSDDAEAAIGIRRNNNETNNQKPAIQQAPNTSLSQLAQPNRVVSIDLTS